MFEDDEVAQLPIYDSCLISRMPSGAVAQEVKDSVIRTYTPKTIAFRSSVPELESFLGRPYG